MSQESIKSKITELREKMQKMDTDFDGMQQLQAKIEVLKEIIHDESEGIESDWFDIYGEVLVRRIQKHE